jgi:hypothetical protein
MNKNNSINASLISEIALNEKMCLTSRKAAIDIMIKGPQTYKRHKDMAVNLITGSNIPMSLKQHAVKSFESLNHSWQKGNQYLFRVMNNFMKKGIAHKADIDLYRLARNGVKKDIYSNKKFINMFEKAKRHYQKSNNHSLKFFMAESCKGMQANLKESNRFAETHIKPNIDILSNIDKHTIYVINRNLLNDNSSKYLKDIANKVIEESKDVDFTLGSAKLIKGIANQREISANSPEKTL